MSNVQILPDYDADFAVQKTLGEVATQNPDITCTVLKKAPFLPCEWCLRNRILSVDIRSKDAPF